MKQNVIDKVVSLFSPQAGVKRATARLKLDLLRGYDGAKSSLSSSGWYAPSTDANSEISYGLIPLRNKSRDLVRNHPYARRIISTLVSNVIGDGITPSFEDENRQSLWDAWADSTDCDADGDLNFYGLTALAFRSSLESGECLIRFRRRRLSDGYKIPLQLQLLEGDFLDLTKNQIKPRIINGVEFDDLGKRVAYWLYEEHPGSYYGNLKSNRVPASEVFHLFFKERPGQVRGEPRLAPVINKLKDLDEYQFALLFRAKVEACLGVFITTDEEAHGTFGTPITGDKSGGSSPIRQVEPGMISYLKPGESVETINPTGSSAHNDYSKQHNQAISVGAGVTYDQLTGDLSQANYSSLRAGKVEQRRQSSQIQWHYLIPTFCERVVKEFEKTIQLAGLVKDNISKVEWMPPAHEMIDPLKDTNAEILQVQAGFKTMEQAVSERGYNFKRQVKKIAENNQFLDDYGVKLSSDARSGLNNKPTEDSNKEDEEEDAKEKSK